MPLFRKIVYAVTQKPSQYVHVEKPRTLQDLRQIQYNNWCRRYGVYNGSYLPKDPTILRRKGWTEITSPENKNGSREFVRKSDSQMVRHDPDGHNKRGTPTDEHYHWGNVISVAERRRVPKDIMYRDRYGRPCKEGKPESHLAPLDKDYNYRK